jgi:hypothetical protein
MTSMTPEKVAYIRSLEDSDSGLDIDELIAEAKKPTNVCHDEFEWDPTRGMQILWRQQARELIRRVHLETRVVSGATVIPYYVADPANRHDHLRYTSLLRLRESRARASAVMLDEMRRVQSAVQRASAVASVLNPIVATELDKMVRSLTVIKSMVETETGEHEHHKKGRGPKARAKAPPPRRRGGSSPRIGV